MTPTPNHALQPTATAVTACAADHRHLSAHRHRPRQPPPWLSLGSLGVSTRILPMKVLFIALAIFGALPCVAQQTDKPTDDSPREQMRRLLHDLPHQSFLTHCLNLVKQYEAARDKDELDHARKTVELAQELVPKIRALIKPDTSIFDYPGLLAAGSITDYTELRRLPDGTSEGSYELYLGVFLGSQGTAPTEFRLLFNQKGIITKFITREWKK